MEAPAAAETPAVNRARLASCPVGGHHRGKATCRQQWLSDRTVYRNSLDPGQPLAQSGYDGNWNTSSAGTCDGSPVPRLQLALTSKSAARGTMPRARHQRAADFIARNAPLGTETSTACKRVEILPRPGERFCRCHRLSCERARRSDLHDGESPVARDDPARLDRN